MSCRDVLKTRVAPEIKLRAKMIADLEFLSEAAWLKRLVVREIRAATDADKEGSESVHAGSCPRSATPLVPSGRSKPTYVRLRIEDRLLLEARAAARGLRPATYLAVLARAHLRALTPLPKAELLALRGSIAELAAIGRNINQIAKAANEGGRLPSSMREEFRAMLKICEATRDNTKALLMANEASWSTGHATPPR